MSEKGAILRLRVSHFFSKWFLYPLCYHVIRYRRKVVRNNLCMAFPEKTPHEITQLQKSFYLNFSDMIMEVLTGWRFSETEMRRFVVIHNKEEVSERCKHYGGQFFMLGHLFNWEWIVDYANQFADYGIECGTVYKQLNNRFFDRLMHKLRSRRGGFMIEMKRLLRVVIARKNSSELPPVGYAMLADQRPRRNAAQHRTTLLNREVGVLAGTEQLAVRFHYPVYFVQIHCPKRGYYEVTPVIIYDPETDGDLPQGTVTERFTRLLEENIRHEPSRWLWSHKRFSGSNPTGKKAGNQ